MEHLRQHVALTDARFYAYHGYYPEEQVLGNEFVVAIEVTFDRQGEVSDELGQTVNYETLYEIASTAMQVTRKLLESVAEAILGRVRLEFPFTHEVTISICKTNPPFGGDRAKASVTLTWKSSVA